MPDQVPDEVKHDRIERLVDHVQYVALDENRRRIGLVEEVLVEGPSRTDAARLRGRTRRRNTTVHFVGEAQPGELVDVEIEAATLTTLAAGRARRRPELPPRGARTRLCWRACRDDAYGLPRRSRSSSR